MPGPLHWFINPERLKDDRLVDQLFQLLVQLGNERWYERGPEKQYLEARTLVHLRELERRIAQERLFD